MISKKFTQDSDGDYIYYNIEVRNSRTDDKTIDAVFSENRINPILKHPSDYQLAVMRFSVPTTNIPVFIFPGVGDPQLAVRLEYNGLIINQDLIFVQNASPPSTKFGNAVYSYQELADMINTAFEQAFWFDYPVNTVKNLPLSPTTAPPYLVFNSETNLFSLFAEQVYSTAPIETKVYLNTRLHNLFPSFQSFALKTSNNPPTTFWQILIKDNLNNIPTAPANYYEMKQEFSTLGLWNTVTTLAFETTAIPVEQEFQGTQANVQRSIITDFEPQAEINDRQKYQFFPQGPLRYYDLDSKQELRRIDINAIWSDKQGNNYTVTISPGESFTLKILFRKKKELLISEIIDASNEEEL